MVNVKVGAVLLALGGAIILSVQVVRRLETKAELPAIVPLPQRVETHRGSFNLSPATRIVVDSFPRPAGELLAARLRQSTGYELPICGAAKSAEEKGTIRLTAEGAPARLGPEGYDLQVAPDRVTVRAIGQAGLFYGTQSLLELLPPAIFSPQRLQARDWSIPCVFIEDQPRFPWRGVMLDVSRHFLPPAEVKRLLDVMALHKLNTFHWHLTDDQGWRIEIKKYPRLTEVGAWRPGIGFNLDPKSTRAYGPDGQYGGFYTQADIRDVIAYAQARHITIVPEIEMPGHASAALAAYPQFSCSGGPYTTDMSKAVSAGVFCAGKEETFKFLEDVLTEVMELFPGQFIHIGGDEVTRANWRNCPSCQARMALEGLKGEHELQTYFMKRIEKFVNARGKRVIGWSEIRDDHLAQSTAVMDWIGGGVEAARAGHDAVMSPEEYCYLDFYQSKDRSTEPPAAGAYLPLGKVYAFEPVPAGLDSNQQTHILGAQGNIWTEYMASLAQVEYMAFPRLSALAEVVWSPKDARNWKDFTRRLAVQEQRLDQLGVQSRHAGARTFLSKAH